MHNKTFWNVIWKLQNTILQSLVKSSYPVKQQAILKSRACLLSTFLTLVLQVWWQFGQVTVVGHLLKYIPSVVAPCKYPSDNYNWISILHQRSIWQILPGLTLLLLSNMVGDQWKAEMHSLIWCIMCIKNMCFSDIEWK